MVTSNGWTGGQYSLFRFVLGAWLGETCVRLAVPGGGPPLDAAALAPPSSALLRLFPNVFDLSSATAFATAVLLVSTALAGLFAIGWHDRTAAAVLIYVGACLVLRDPPLLHPAFAWLGWLLLAHLLLPPAPYGSWAARGRTDPTGGWSMPQPVFGAAWVALVLAHAYGGVVRLTADWRDPVAFGLLAFAPLALAQTLRPFLWTASLVLHLVLLVVSDSPAPAAAMVLFLLFTFDPLWVRPLPGARGDVLFYDGTCGLCHRAVRFVLAEDREANWRFAPLAGEAFRARVPEEERAGLPDSMVVATGDGRLLVRSDAWLNVMKRAGGVWRLLAEVVAQVPRVVRDRIYDFVAAVRYRLFARPSEACPVLPAALRARFDS